MVSMKRFSLAAAAGILLASALAPAVASATTIELGATKTTPITTPTCPKGVAPKNCTIILTKATGLETIRDSVAYPTTVKHAGSIVAWTVGLGALSTHRATVKKEIKNLDNSYLGPASASIVVLKPGRKRFSWTVVATSPPELLQPFLGTVVQFPLDVPLKVVRGETIGLSVPTWAPVLTYMLPVKKFAYRQSRMANCSNPAGLQQAQTKAGVNTRYVCDYPGTRVEYSATEITTPVPPKNYIH